MNGLTLRNATPQDRPFVECVYFETQRWLIEKLFGWRGDDVERSKFDEFYDEFHTQIVQLQGEDVGWLTVLRESNRIEVDAIYVVPEKQGAGLGTLLMEQLIAESEEGQKMLTLSTAKINPARRLYERLGFVVVDESEFKVYMERSPRTLADANEPVALDPYDGEWPTIFTLEAARVQRTLKPFGLAGIEHVGSTAIPGMTAKPIMDIMAGVENMGRLPVADNQLWRTLGYEWGHGSDRPEDWLYFIKRDGTGNRIVHLHVVPFEGEFWKRLIAFRDALREDADLAREYETLKVRLAAEHGHDRLRYRDEKAAFVERITAERLRGGNQR